MAMVVKEKGTPPALLPLDERIGQIRAKIENEAVREIFDRAMTEVDREAFVLLQEKHRDEILAAGPAAPPKYLDLPFWFHKHAVVFHALGLDASPPRKILDIGSGGCQFLSICKTYGHESLGLDIRWPLYFDMAELFGVRRVLGAIVHGNPLPEGTNRSDVIVIHAQNFDYHREADRYWTLEEWAGFLEHLTREHMNLPGRLFMRLNRRVLEDGSHDFFWPLMEMAKARGARTARKPPRLTFNLTEPLTFPDIESRW